MGSARLASRSPEISGLAVLRRQGYGLFAAKIWFKSHELMKKFKPLERPVVRSQIYRRRRPEGGEPALQPPRWRNAGGSTQSSSGNSSLSNGQPMATCGTAGL